MALKIRLLPAASIKMRALPQFPVRVAGTNGIDATLSGGTITVSPAFDDQTALVSVAAADRDNTFVLVYNSADSTYKRLALDVLLTSISGGLDDTLVSIAALTPTANQGIYFSGTDVAAAYSLTAGGRALAGVTAAADKLAYFNSVSTALTTDLSSFARTILDDTTAGAVLTTLGVSAFAQTLLDDAAASDARTTLGLVIGTNVQAYDAELAAIAGLTSAADKAPYFTGSGTAAVADFTASGRAMVGAASAAAQTALLSAFTGDSGAGGVKGLVPAPSAGDAAASKFLKADGTWTAPAGGGDLLAANNLSDLASFATARENFGVSQGIHNLSLAVSAAASALTIALKTKAGADPSASSPVSIGFRNNTLTTGDYDSLDVTAATSLVVSSGSTLGVTSSTAFRLWVVGFNDGGTFRLGVINCSGANQIYGLADHVARSSTAEGGAGAADSAGVIYTGTAVTTKAMRILGFLEWNTTGVTAGTWTTSNLIQVQLFHSGVAQPGCVVQTVHGYDETGSTTTSTSDTDVTGASYSITPTSAANKIKAAASASGTISAGGAGVNSEMYCKLVRGSTAISNYRALGVVSGSGTNIQTDGSISHIVIDTPQSASATTYKLQHKSSVGTATAGTSRIGMIIEEIMC